MSLLNLVHQSVVIRFTDAAKLPYDSASGYVFRLTGVDAMGFLQIQDLRVGPDAEHETISEPYWINKDLVREIHEYASATGKDSLKFTGVAAKRTPPPKPAIDPIQREMAPKLSKPKAAKAKPALT